MTMSATIDLKIIVAVLALLFVSQDAVAKPQLAKNETKAKIPDYLHMCRRNDPKVNECLRESVHSLRPYLAKGIKELNIPPMEPLYIGDMTILDGGRNSLNVKTKGLNIYGASNFEIKKLDGFNGGKRFVFEILLPRLQGEGTYDINGQLLALPLKGNGRFRGNFTNFKAFVKLEFGLRKKDKTDYITVKELDVKIKTGKGHVRLYNLFNGDKALGDVINDTINQNFEVFTGELIAPIERALEKKFLSITSKIFDSFPADDLFPL